MRPDRADSPCARSYDTDPRAPHWVGFYGIVDTTEADSPAHLFPTSVSCDAGYSVSDEPADEERGR